MKSFRISMVMAMFAVIVCSCRKKEVFPDLAKQVQGDYVASSVVIAHYNPAWNTGNYNPKDSSQVGLVSIRKIDALSVNVRLLLRKQDGKILYDDNVDCELSRDINNKGWIIFDSYEGQVGALIVNDKKVGYDYLSMGTRNVNGVPKDATAGFTVRL